MATRLGILSHAMGEMASLVMYMDRALAIRQKTAGMRRRLTACALVNMAMAFKASGNKARADSLLMQSLETLTQVIRSEGHPDPRVAAARELKQIMS